MSMTHTEVAEKFCQGKEARGTGLSSTIVTVKRGNRPETQELRIMSHWRRVLPLVVKLRYPYKQQIKSRDGKPIDAQPVRYMINGDAEFIPSTQHWAVRNGIFNHMNRKRNKMLADEMKRIKKTYETEPEKIKYIDEEYQKAMKNYQELKKEHEAEIKKAKETGERVPFFYRTTLREPKRENFFPSKWDLEPEANRNLGDKLPPAVNQKAEPFVTVSFSALMNVVEDSDLEFVRILDKTGDEYLKIPYTDKKTGEEKFREVHRMGSSLFTIKDKYFLMAGNAWSFFLVQLSSPVETIKEAYEQLKPPELRGLEGVTDREVGRNHVYLLESYNKGAKFVRQGEFFFVPQPELTAADIATDGAIVPVTVRSGQLYGGGYSHTKELRTGARIMKHADLSALFGNGGNYHRARDVIMTADHKIFARGQVYHRQHMSVPLGEMWHRVLMNTALNSWAVEGRID